MRLARERVRPGHAARHGGTQVVRLAPHRHPCPHPAVIGVQDGIHARAVQRERAGHWASQRLPGQRHQVLLVYGPARGQRLSGKVARPAHAALAAQRPAARQLLRARQFRLGAEGQVIRLRGAFPVPVQEGVFRLRRTERHAAEVAFRRFHVALDAHGAPAARRDPQFHGPLAACPWPTGGGAQRLCQPLEGGRGVRRDRPVLLPGLQVRAALRVNGAVPALAVQCQGNVVALMGGVPGDVRDRHETRVRHPQRPAAQVQFALHRPVAQHVAPGNSARRHARPVVVEHAGVGVQVHHVFLRLGRALAHLHVGVQFAFLGAAPHRQRAVPAGLHSEVPVRNVDALPVHADLGVAHVHAVQQHLPAARRAAPALATAQQLREFEVHARVVHRHVQPNGPRDGVDRRHVDVRAARRHAQARLLDHRAAQAGRPQRAAHSVCPHPQVLPDPREDLSADQRRGIRHQGAQQQRPAQHAPGPDRTLPARLLRGGPLGGGRR